MTAVAIPPRPIGHSHDHVTSEGGSTGPDRAPTPSWDLRLALWALDSGLRRSNRTACMHVLRGGRCEGHAACSGCWGRAWWSPSTARAWVDWTGRVTHVTLRRWWDDERAGDLEDRLRAEAERHGVIARVRDGRVELRPLVTL